MEYKKKADEVSAMIESYEEAKKKSQRDMDALHLNVQSLMAENDKLNKSKKKFQSEVSVVPKIF